MIRWCLFLVLGVSALVWQLGDPGRLHAQHAGAGMHMAARPMFHSGFRGGFMPGFGNRMFDPRFDNRMFDPRFDNEMFERLSDPRFR
jgi:hypothetical protein